MPNSNSTRHLFKCYRFGLLLVNEVQHVPYATDKAEAQTWLNEGSPVYARTVLNGHSGAGIVVVEPGGELPNAPLYTKAIGFNKRHEYRVHVIGGEVVYVQKKKRKTGWEENPEYSNTIRNHHTGWIYATEGVEIPEDVQNLAIQSVAALGLDFGAVDIIVVQGQGYVLEVNTAPGLDGTTIEVYTTGINKLIQQRLGETA